MRIDPIPAFSDNYIWCLENASVGSSASARHSEVLVVDPGQAQPVASHLKEHNLALAAILITHHHADHTGGVQELKAATGATVYGPKNSPKAELYDKHLVAGDSINVCGLDFAILETPGHTLDHIAYFCAECADGPILFCGDTMFAAGCGRLFEGTAAQMVQSLGQFRSLPSATKAYPTHEYTLANLKFAGEVEPDNKELAEFTRHCRKLRQDNIETLPVTIAGECAYNPFLRWDSPQVRQAAAKRLGIVAEESTLSDTQVFAEIRAWKDSF